MRVRSERPSSASRPVPQRPPGIWLVLAYMSMVAIVCGPAGMVVVIGDLPVVYGETAIPAADARLVGFLILGSTILAAALAYGLIRHRAWTRAGLVGWLIVQSLAAILLSARLEPAVAIATGLAGFPAMFGLWLYLYRRRSVVAYYDSLVRAS